VLKLIQQMHPETISLQSFTTWWRWPICHESLISSFKWEE